MDKLGASEARSGSLKPECLAAWNILEGPNLRDDPRTGLLVAICLEHVGRP